jgi:branched-chain amino acid transport system substrate-binding protein
VLVAAQLPDSNPIKKAALEYVNKYEAAHGKGTASTFGAHAWDAGKLLANAVPEALKKAQPGTPEFRKALRDALEKTKNLTAAHGVFNMSPQDHLGFDQRSRVMVKIDRRQLEARAIDCAAITASCSTFAGASAGVRPPVGAHPTLACV